MKWAVPLLTIGAAGCLASPPANTFYCADGGPSCFGGLVCIDTVCVSPTGAIGGSTSGNTGTSSGTASGSTSIGTASGSTSGATGATGTSSGTSSTSGSTGAVDGGQLILLAGQPGGWGNADGIGADARFDAPNQIVSDGQGKLYVADTLNCLIREIDLDSGVVTTLAGSGCDTGDVNGQGTAASFGNPVGLARDRAGNLYFSEQPSNVIRKIDTATFVSLWAGEPGQSGAADGTALTASFNAPAGLAWDATLDALFVADTGSDAIRMVYDAGGQDLSVLTVAGARDDAGSDNGDGQAATFSGPTGIAANGYGQLMVIDTDNCTVRQIDETDWSVSTFLGSPGECGFHNGQDSSTLFSFPVPASYQVYSTGIAFDDGGNLYVGDTDNGRIRVNGGVVTGTTTLAGSGDAGEVDGTGTNASFITPTGVTWDGQGSLYVADNDGFTIRKIDIASQGVTTVAGAPNHFGALNGYGPDASFDIPLGLGFDGVQTLYVADTENDLIRSVDINSGLVQTVALSATLQHPLAVLVGRGFYANTLFVAEPPSTILEVSLDGGPASTLVNAGFDFDKFFAAGLALDPASQLLYVADNQNNDVRAVNLANGRVTTVAGVGTCDGGAGGSLCFPLGLALDGDGGLFVADYGDALLRRIDLDAGSVSTVAGTPGMSGCQQGVGVALSRPGALAWSGGTLYFADFTCGTVRSFAPVTGMIATIAGTPFHIGVKTGPLPNSGLNTPAGLALDGNGRLFVLDATEDSILEVTQLP